MAVPYAADRPVSLCKTDPCKLSKLAAERNISRETSIGAKCVFEKSGQLYWFSRIRKGVRNQLNIIELLSRVDLSIIYELAVSGYP